MRLETLEKHIRRQPEHRKSVLGDLRRLRRKIEENPRPYIEHGIGFVVAAVMFVLGLYLTIPFNQTGFRQASARPAVSKTEVGPTRSCRLKCRLEETKLQIGKPTRPMPHKRGGERQATEAVHRFEKSSRERNIRG